MTRSLLLFRLKPVAKPPFEGRPAGVVYRIPCNACDIVYIGDETARIITATTRFREHKNDIRNAEEINGLFDYLQTHEGNSIDIDGRVHALLLYVAHESSLQC